MRQVLGLQVWLALALQLGLLLMSKLLGQPQPLQERPGQLCRHELGP